MHTQLLFPGLQLFRIDECFPEPVKIAVLSGCEVHRDLRICGGIGKVKLRALVPQ